MKQQGGIFQMSVQLLDKTRKINKLLHNSSTSKVVFNDICEVLTDILDSNVLVLSKKGKVLGIGCCEGVQELKELKAQYRKLLSEAPHRTCYTCLYDAVPSYIASLRDTYQDFMEEIVTDDQEIFLQIQKYLDTYQPENRGLARLYQDSLLPLKKLYSLEKAVAEALQKKVWLKSGGYLVIEPTEAMTVIDVNSGK